MNQSTNYNFNLPEGTDLVNLLVQLIPNWENLDSILKGVENQAFTNCTEITSLGVHAISRTNADGKILKWIATANFTAGDTFTVDGNVVAASTPSGGTLATNAYVSGAVIIAALNSDESAMTVFVTGSNVAADSERLGGELPTYYAKQSDMNTAQIAITDLDNTMGTTSISGIGDGTATGAISKLNNDINKGYVEVTADGVKTNSQLFNALYALVNTSKVSKDTVLYYGSHTIYHIIIDSPLTFSVASVDATYGETVSMVTVNSTGSTMYIGRNGTRIDNSSAVPANGYNIKLVY